ncbi:MAG: 50S ribosomal protein L30 [Legionellales bacterium]|jgi:large subunit ribosomal protein L30|nr:50S ribosomal protein L30 [Legionellales bacterium]
MSKLLPSEAVKKLKIKLIKSTIGSTKKQQASVKGLGLRRLGSEVIVTNNQENRGMANAIRFLLHVEEA